MNNLLNYLLNVIIAFDVFCSTLCGFSQADITISSCCGLAIRRKTSLLLRGLGWVLNTLFPGHTDGAITSDVARAQQAATRLLTQ